MDTTLKTKAEALLGEPLLNEPVRPESWECCGSDCGDACIQTIYWKANWLDIAACGKPVICASSVTLRRSVCRLHNTAKRLGLANNFKKSAASA